MWLSRSRPSRAGWILRRLSLFACCAALGCAGAQSSPSAIPKPEDSAAPEAPEETAALPEAREEAGAAPPVADSSRESSGPRSLIDFIGVGRGERVADLGSGAGYSLERIAEVVGPAGIVYARHDPRTLSASPGSAARPQGMLPGNIVVMPTDVAAPLTPDARDLDLVTMLFAYHEVVARFADRTAFNSAVLRALKPGRFYVIAEHSAPEGSGVEAARRSSGIEERIVRADVEGAGFIFVEAAELSSSRASGGQKPRQYLLKFQKPPS